MKKIVVQSQARQAGLASRTAELDSWVLIPVMLLLALGMVMVGSASISIAEGQNVPVYYYLLRHGIFILSGIFLALSFRIIPIDFLQRISRPLMLLAALALLLVFIPGVGHTVNGSARWVRLGIVN